MLVTSLLAGCAAATHPLAGAGVTPAPEVTATALPLPTATAAPLRAWLNPDLPAAFRESLAPAEGCRWVDDPGQADIRVTWLGEEGAAAGAAQWIYALAAPFPTVIDEVTFAALQATWRGQPAEPFAGAPLLLSAETTAAFTAQWGKPAEGAVKIVPAQELVDTAWAERPGWALVPFEELSPRWKVIQVDGLSPLDPALDVSRYPLKVAIGWDAPDGAILPPAAAVIPLPANRNPAHLARVFMTGTTAMARRMALRMEEMGILYPVEKIGQLLNSADLTHISNEVSFYSECPPARPLRADMRFCASPDYFRVLEASGADVIELTGNHLLDWGPEAFAETLQLYEKNGLPFYGGGWTQEQARQPYRVEVNGNKLAFIGCNPSGPEADWATQERPGAAQCDYDWLEAQVRALRQEGYLPIVTIQHIEVYDYKPTSAQRVVSERMALAGAPLVSGSQSHFPQGFAFAGNTLIHYGLGNTFFDQMDFGSSRGFLDRSVFYEGRLISTELFTIKLEDFAQPRLMTPEERRDLLEKIFAESGW